MQRIFSLLLTCLITLSVEAASINQLETEINREDYAQAANTGLEILRIQPNNVKAEFLTALAFQHNNETEKARQHYLHIIRTHPNLPEPRNNLALIYLQQGKHEDAIDLLVSSMQTHPAYATIWMNLKSIYQGLASEAYRKALNSGNDSVSIDVMEGIELTELTTLSVTLEPAATSSADNEVPTRVIDQPVVPAAVIEQVVPALTAAPALVPAPAVSRAEPESSPAVDSIKQLLTQTLLNWANAWSTQNIEQYLNAYTDDFRGNSPSHQAWVEQRRSRILKPGEIMVELSFFEVKSANATRAVVDFQQNFSSPGYQDKVVKRVTLNKVDDAWKISREITIAVL